MIRGTTVRSDTLHHTLSFVAARLGESADRLAGRTRLPALNLGGRIPVSALHRFWGIVAERQHHPLPAWVGRSLPLERLGPFGFAILTAPNGREALQVAASAFPLINEGAQLRVFGGPRTYLRFMTESPRTVGEAASEESTLSHFAAGLSHSLSSMPMTLRFRHRAPAYARAMADYLGLQIEWGAAATELEIDQRSLDTEPRLASTETHAVLKLHIENELGRLHASPTVLGEVKSTIADKLEDGATARDVAASNGISERTLRRRLAAEGTGLRNLRDAERARQALLLIADERRSVVDVALELGFSDASTFARAFRRWYGSSPAEARRRARGSEPLSG